MVTVKMNFLPCFLPAPSRVFPLAKNQLTFSLFLSFQIDKTNNKNHSMAPPAPKLGKAVACFKFVA